LPNFKLKLDLIAVQTSQITCGLPKRTSNTCWEFSRTYIYTRSC